MSLEPTYLASYDGSASVLQRQKQRQKVGSWNPLEKSLVPDKSACKFARRAQLRELPPEWPFGNDPFDLVRRAFSSLAPSAREAALVQKTFRIHF